MVVGESAIGIFEFMEEACKRITGICFAELQPRKTKGAVKSHRTPIAAKMFWSKFEDFLYVRAFCHTVEILSCGHVISCRSASAYMYAYMSLAYPVFCCLACIDNNARKQETIIFFAGLLHLCIIVNTN